MRFKRLISGVVGVAIISASVTTAFAAKFSDVSGHWSESYVNSMVSQGYIKGYDDGTFKPDKTVSNTEALILLSRMLGVEKSEYALSADNALAAYSSTLSKYNTEYKKEISYLLYRGVIDKDDLDTYISDAKKNNALLRYQCAMLLTKLLGAEEEVQSSVFISSSYSDTAQIPAEARPYVEYVKDAKIMEGMGTDSYGDPIFGPNESVTRGQMAKMLSSLISVLDISTKSGTISAIDAFNDTVTIGGNKYTVEDKTIIKLDGESSKFSDLAEGMEASVFVLRGEVSMIEAVSAEAEAQPQRGVIISVTSDSSGKKIVISDAENTTNRTTYNVSDNVKVLINKAIDSYGKLKSNQYVELTLDGGVVTQIEVIDKNASVVATLSSKDINSKNPSITVSDVKGNKTTYYCNTDGVTVTRNSKTSNLSELVAGDSVVLKLVYNKITKITAESESQNLTGKIETITHSTNGSTLNIKSDNKVKEYSVGSSTTILIDNESATVYDLRPGSDIKFRAESSLITKLETTQTASKNSISGEVTAVQSNYNLLFVDDGDDEIAIGITSSTKIVKATTGSTLKLSGISKGDTVTVTANNATGMYVATVIIVD